MKGKKIIGRIEYASFPALKLNRILAKIDTGAYHSSIHCTQIEEKKGKLYCSFDPVSKKGNAPEWIVFDTYTIAVVKSSNGATERRYKIMTQMRFGDKLHRIALTLTNRQKMRYSVLIGRKFLKKKYLVDVSCTNLLHQPTT